MGGFTRIQIKALIFLVSTFLLGLLVQHWQLRQPLPETDSGILARFLAISDSLAKAENQADAGETAAEQQKININAAPESELTRLPGIGKVMAGRIVAYREQNGAFKKPEDLMLVKGIGKKTFKKLADRIVLK